MKRKDIINEIISKYEGKCFETQTDSQFFRAVQEAERGWNIPETAVLARDYISNAARFVELMREYGVEYLVNCSGWGSEIDRCFELQEAGLQPLFFDAFTREQEYNDGTETKRGLVFKLRR